MLENMWDKIKGVSPKTIEKINNEGFESDDPDREEKGAAVLIGTKEEVERQRELIDPETACIQTVGARKGDGVPFV